ncbi:MAG: glycosyl transferase group 1 [Frankiales bacterium]|nr:glycosyl transferase group 1 [Frankiales bacterium]
MRIGIVCPYTWDVPGGVQAHVRDLAESLLALGHEVSVLTPVDDPDTADLPSYVVPGGRAVPVPYNGSVARLTFGPLSLTRTRRWLRKGRFDVLHLHEPTVPSLSMIACFAARGPMVATFHTATARSRALQVFGTAMQPGLEKITGRIAVSPAARRVVVEHLGHDAVLIPNGVRVSAFAGARPLDGLSAGPRVVFLGRIDEDRKGLAVLLDALPRLVKQVPDVQVLVAGPGDPPEVPPNVRVLGLVSAEDKPRVFASGDVYCAPNTHGESFGIVLIEAMAAGTPVVASDLEAFRRVLEDGDAGVLFPVGDSAALADALADLLRDEDRRAALSATGSQVVLDYDWSEVTRQIVEVYETVAVPAAVELDDDTDEPDVEDFGQEDDPGRVSETLRRWLAVVRERVAP